MTRQPILHTIRVHHGMDDEGHSLVTVVQGPDQARVRAAAQAIPGATHYDVEQWWSEGRLKSTHTVTSLDTLAEDSTTP